MRSLPQCFTIIADPRGAQGRRHRLPVVPGIAAGAILCGIRGYKAIANWADALGQKARERFGCRRENGHYVVPSELVIRDCLVRIDPGAPGRTFFGERWWRRAPQLGFVGPLILAANALYHFIAFCHAPTSAKSE